MAKNAHHTRRGKVNRQTARLETIERVLGTFIGWVAQSSVGVISISEAECLLRDLSAREKNKRGVRFRIANDIERALPVS